MTNNLSIIITLFKTPLNRLKILKQYKNYPILIFDQETKNNSEQISKIIDVNFEYFHSNNNLGLCKSTNFRQKSFHAFETCSKERPSGRFGIYSFQYIWGLPWKLVRKGETTVELLRSLGYPRQAQGASCYKSLLHPRWVEFM